MRDEAKRLNWNAYMALNGIYGRDEGEEHIATLLRSKAPIDPLVRNALAEALSANGTKNSKIRLRLSDLQDGEFARKMTTRARRLEFGEEVLGLQKTGQSRTEAERVVAGRHNCSLESVRKATDYARKAAKWDAKRQEAKDTAQGRLAWQTIFHTADVLGISPEQHLANLEEGFAKLEAGKRNRNQR